MLVVSMSSGAVRGSGGRSSDGDDVGVGAVAGATVMTVVGVPPLPPEHAVVASPAASAVMAAVRVACMWCSSRVPPGLGGEGSTVDRRLHRRFTAQLRRS